MKRFLTKGLCVALTVMMLLGICAVGISAATVVGTSFISEYVADFEGNYYSDLSSDNCTSGAIVDNDGGKALEVKVKSSSQDNRFEIYNSSKGTLALNDGKIYAVTINYKVTQVAGEMRDTNYPTVINLVRYTGSGDELVKVKSFPNATYYAGDTTEWITSTIVFKAGVASSPEYNRIAVNVVSASCSDIDTNIESGMTKIVFDNISVKECTESTKSIEFNSNGGSYCDALLAQSGEAIELPTPTRDLYVFAGWYSDAKLTKKFTKTSMPGDLTTKLYAKWDISPEAIAVNFETYNGTTVDMAVGRAGDSLELPELTRDNCNFAGWYDKDFTTRYTASTFPEASTTLYAKWEIIPQLITFENVAQFPKPDNSVFTQRCLIGDDKYKTKKDAYKSDNALHYSFQRGFDLTGSAGKGTPAAVMLINEMGEKVKLVSGKTYVFTFKYRVVDYISDRGSICLIAAGAGGAWSSDRNMQSYKTAMLSYNAEDEKKGWQTGTFTHKWESKTNDGSYCYIAIGGEAEVYVDEILVYEYDEKFKPQTDKVMLCFDSGIAPLVDTIYADRGTEVTLPTLEMEGYRFLGWTYDADNLQPVDGETLKLNFMYQKLYADWYKIPPVVEEPESEPEPQPEPESQPQSQQKELVEEGKDNTVLYIIIAVVAVVVVIAAVVVVVVIVLVKRKKKN